MTSSSLEQQQAEIAASRLRSTAAAIGEAAAHAARHDGARSSGADLAEEHMITCAAMALGEVGGLDRRAAHAVVSLLLAGLESLERTRLTLTDQDRARAERAAQYRAEQHAQEHADREALRAADALEARRLAREWRRRGGQGLDLDRVIQLVTQQHPRLAEHVSHIRAGWLAEDERINQGA